MSEVMVSISCITYNHENYIKDALDSLLMQKTNFKYEILVYDDASTDGTPDIIREYEKSYPDFIKPVYQPVNQYSRGVKVGKFNNERARGKYIAICEGDDYWTDPCKLQKQVDLMEKHPECTLCVHASYKVCGKDKRIVEKVRPGFGDKFFTVEEVIESGGGIFATNSILYPGRLVLNRPKFFEIAPVGDFPLLIYLSILGKVYYIDEFMSAYRVGVDGSWTSRLNCDIEKRVLFVERMGQMLNEIDEYSNFKYSRSIERCILKHQFDLLLAQARYKDVKNDKFAELYKKLDSSIKMKLFLRYYFPFLYAKIKNIKQTVTLTAKERQ
jgi:glycosyltransferase involved in cell wall biosynthesis